MANHLAGEGIIPRYIAGLDGSPPPGIMAPPEALTMIPIEPTDLPEPPAWLRIEKRVAELLDGVQNRCEQLARHRHFGQLERHVLCTPNRFGPDFDQLFPKRGQ